MSRLGVIRWNLPPETFSNVSTNGTLPTLSSPSTEEWLQADVLISIGAISVFALHTHFCHLTKVGMSTIFALASLVLTLALAPVVGTVLLMFTVYRQLVEMFLRSTSAKFAGLLHGTDAFWALEDDASLSIINVLALADFSFIVTASSQDDEPLQTITELIQDRLLTISAPFPKLMCHRRRSRLGYFHWEKQDTINISDHIRWMEIEEQGDKTITEAALKNFVSSVNNSSLPSNHAAGWEVLVGRYPIKPSSDLFDAMENGGWITKSCAGVRYPVLFRIHHSIGDGVALVNLLLDSLADPCTRSSTPVSNLRCTSPSFDRNFVSPKNPVIFEENEEETPVISSWEESDIPSCTKSSDSFSVVVAAPSSDFNQEKINFDHLDALPFNYNKNDSPDSTLQATVANACQKVLQFVEDTKEFKKKLSEKKMKDFDVVVNNRPGAEFLDLINKATNLENPYSESEQPNQTSQRLEIVLHKLVTILYFSTNFIFKIIESLKALTRQWSVILFAPASIFNQILIQAQDVNLLHGPRLSGHKVVAWYFEQQDNPDQLLMAMIKRIRSKTGVKFSDVLLTALSASFESFYIQCNEVPQFITVVIPARLGPPPEVKASTTVIKAKNFSTKVTKITENFDADGKLENKFSVAMLPLPIASCSTGKLRLFSKLRDVKRHCDVLRKSPDYLINYWLLRVVATLLPAMLLRPLLKSTHSTLVLSNLPGPTRLTKLAGHTLHDLVFWIPNRTTTGVGVTVLSYAGRLQLGLMADRALISCQHDAQLILDGVATAINQMDQISSPTC